MPSSSLYTLKATSSKRKNWWPSTIALSIISIAGALGINQHLAASSANSFGGGGLSNSGSGSLGGSTLGGSTSGTGTNSGSGTSTGTGSGSSTGTGTGTSTAANSTKTATGDPIYYPFGTIQVKVTQKAGKLTAIDYIQSTASRGRDQAFPYLVQYAIKANGSSFGNLGGATYTTDAFKQALDSAVSKL